MAVSPSCRKSGEYTSWLCGTCRLHPLSYTPLYRLQEFTRLAGRFVEGRVGNAPFNLGTATLELPPPIAQDFYALKFELLDLCRQMAHTEQALVMELTASRVDFSEDLVRRSERFRYALQDIMIPSRPFHYGVAALERAIFEGRQFTRDLRRELARDIPQYPMDMPQ